MKIKIRKLSTTFLCLLMVAAVFAEVPVNIGAEEEPPEEPRDLPEEEHGWWIDAHGTYFEITESAYLNITLTSRENIHVYIESIPNIINCHIDSDCAADSTVITISGFEATTTYYRYQEGNLQEEFMTDETGSYSYTQDISTPHHVFIQETESTVYIDPDGNVIPATAPISRVGEVFTLTGNIYDSIYIQRSGITLDGNGYNVYGPGTGNGIYLSQISGTTIKNLDIIGFSYGIYLSDSDSNTINDNTVSVNILRYGIYLYSSDSNTVSGNAVSADRWSYGIYLYSSDSNTVSGNTVSVSGAHSYGIYLYSSISTVSGNTVSVSGGYDGVYLSSSGSSTVSGNTITVYGPYSSGIYLSSSGSSTVSGNTVLSDRLRYGIYIQYSPNVILFNNAMTQGGITIVGSSLSDWNTHSIDTTNTVDGKPVQYRKSTIGETIPAGAGQVILADCSNMIVENQNMNEVNRGIAVAFGSGNTIHGNTISGIDGIYFYYSTGNTVTENTISAADNYPYDIWTTGIYLYYSDSNTVSGNTVLSDGLRYGIYLYYSSSSTVNGNTVIGGSWGIYLHYSDSNTVNGNTVSGSSSGIYFSFSDSSTVSENIVVSNTGYGINLYHSNSNTIFHNDFVFNNNQIRNVGSTNTWNNPSLEGNYWSDYDGLDDGTGDRTPGDGIGDTNIPHLGVDSYPLMNPWLYNYPPVVFITAPSSGALYPTDTPISFSGYFTDVEIEDTHEATWRFDGITVSGTVTESGGSGTVTDEITFDVAGIYDVKLIVTDNHGGAGTADRVNGLYAQIIVYDPNGGFVTGGGWIDSPYDSYLYDNYATGKATFAFIAKYQKGANIPTGETEFRFNNADFSFRSESYDWLVCGGPKCKFKGSGTLTIKWKWGGPWDEEIEVGFMIMAVDGSQQGGNGKDKFRIKIWLLDYEDYIIYDSIGLYYWDDDADPSEIGGGSIRIHKG